MHLGILGTQGHQHIAVLFQISTDDYFHFEIGNMKSLQDWIVYMLPIDSFSYQFHSGFFNKKCAE